MRTLFIFAVNLLAQYTFGQTIEQIGDDGYHYFKTSPATVDDLSHHHSEWAGDVALERETKYGEALPNGNIPAPNGSSGQYAAQKGNYSGQHTFMIDKGGLPEYGITYGITFVMRSKTGYYDMDPVKTPYAYFIDINGDTLKLHCCAGKPVNYVPFDGYLIVDRSGMADSWTTHFKCTYFSYEIPDIDEFLSHTWVRYIIGGGAADEDMQADGSKFYRKFNKRLRNAARAADRQFMAEARGLTYHTGQWYNKM